MKFPKLLALMLIGSLFSTVGHGSKDKDDFDGPDFPAPSAQRGTAVITGKVTLIGKAPTGDPIDFRSDPACSSQHPATVLDQTVQVDGQNHLTNVLVYVERGAGQYPAPAKAVTLLQEGCQFIPRVFGIQTNQTLEIVNLDPTLHNVHTLSAFNDVFNIGQPTQGMRTKEKFTQPEVPVRFKCDLHYWMHGLAGVFNHPFFAVTASDGTYKITGLPAGSYTLAAFQEKYGESALQEVDLKEGETKSLDFTFTAP
jgi:hypothetical protein